MSAVKRRKQKLGAGDRAFNIVLGGLTAVSVVVILYPLIFVLVRIHQRPDGDISGERVAVAERLQPGSIQAGIPQRGHFYRL